MPDYIPALQGQMGDWRYYITVMKLGKIAKECRLAEEIQANKELDEVIQRQLQKRVGEEMVPYLINEPQRFYGALVVAVYGGEPEFAPVKVAEHQLLDDTEERDSYGFGLLRFDGSQMYYALDGQHRLKSIQEAIRLKPDLAKEQITVIVLKHENTLEGLQRTRRLFSTLNRRAKPTTPGQNIAIDEDDAVAIITRRLVKENEILKKLVLANESSLASKQLKPTKSNDPYITTLAAFYETNEILLRAFGGGLEIDARFKQFRPSSKDLDSYYLFLEKIWDRLLIKCPGFNEVLKGKRTPGETRRRFSPEGEIVLGPDGKPSLGGSVFARPIGHFIIAEVLSNAIFQRKSVDDCIDAIMGNIPMDIDHAPWVDVIWNPDTNTIQGGKAQRKLLVDLICLALGLKIKTKADEIKRLYQGFTKNKNVNLLPHIEWTAKPPSSSEK